MLLEQKLKLFSVAGNMEETWWNPPHSHMEKSRHILTMEEGPKHFVVLIPIYHHNNLHFSVFIRYNNDFGTFLEN